MKFNTSTATNEATAILASAQAAPIQQFTADSENKKLPLAAADHKTFKAHIRAEWSEVYQVFHELTQQTGGRISDIANMKHENIDHEAGVVRYSVAKQSKAARTRAISKAVEAIRSDRKDAAQAKGDYAEYMRLDRLTVDQVKAELTVDQAMAVVKEAGKAKIKTDTKELTRGLLARIKRLGEQSGSEWIFSRKLTGANRVKTGEDGPLTRCTIWRKYTAAFAVLADKIKNATKIGAYGATRKTYARTLLDLAGGVVSKVTEALGHSSEKMTRLYLGLSTDVNDLHRKMIYANE